MSVSALLDVFRMLDALDMHERCVSYARCVKCIRCVGCFICVRMLDVLADICNAVRGRCNRYLGRKSMKTLRTQGAILWVAGVRKLTFSTPGGWEVVGIVNSG